MSIDQIIRRLFLAIAVGIVAAFLIRAVGGAWKSLTEEDVARPALVITDAEWQKMKADDEVLSFVERVNAAALAKPYWAEDFRRAHYDAFGEETAKHAMRRYSNGEPFTIRGTTR